jgi:hypothetical protein
MQIQWTRGWRSISGTSVLDIKTSQPWLTPASTWDTAFNSTIPPSSPLTPDTWTASLGRPLRLSSIPTTWTERWSFVSASHGSLSSVPWRYLRNMTPDLQRYAGQCMLGSLVLGLRGKCKFCSRGFPLNNRIPALSYLLAHVDRPYPLLSVAPSPTLAVLI